jgi:hypothetical protein
MNRVQELGAQARRDKQLPAKALPWADVLTRMEPSIHQAIVREGIRAFLKRTADWKSATGKRVKKELKAMMEQGE